MSAPTLTDDLVTVRDTLYDDGESPAEVAFARIEQWLKAQEAALQEIARITAFISGIRVRSDADAVFRIARAALSSVYTELGR